MLARDPDAREAGAAKEDIRMKRAVIVICDSLRRDLITPRDAPFLSELGQRSAQFANHSSVFPSTTRTSAASIATGCLPARHGLLGNTMALDEGDGLVCLSVGKPDFRDRLHRATGRTLHMPTMAERVARAGETAIAFSNVSPGAAYFLDPDGYGWVYNPAGSFGPGRRPLPAEEGLAVERARQATTPSTERFCAEVLRERAPALAVLWLSEPDYTGHHTPLGLARRIAARSPAPTRMCAASPRPWRALDPSGEDILFVVGSDHGMESVAETIDLDGLLIEAGLKRAPASSDVVVAPNGTAALLYFADPDRRSRCGRSRDFSKRRNGSAASFAGDGSPPPGCRPARRRRSRSRSEPTTAPTRTACRATATSCATRSNPRTRPASASMAGSAPTSRARSCSSPAAASPRAPIATAHR